MKLRIKGNSLRLRLSQTEVKQFHATGKVEASIQFTPTQSLQYILIRGPVNDIVKANFDTTTPFPNITVSIPALTAIQWAVKEEEVSVRGFALLEDGERLELLIEKDFECLQKRENGEDEDGFPNPLAKEV